MKTIRTYLVGGAVRDQLLGVTVKDRDWVVTGATPEIMLQQSYQPVGKDFPVFLHPNTHEEYALARTERKTSLGYHGFQFNTSPNVTLKEDLARRDLTINALAQDEQGNIIDHYGGQQDLQQRILRHVSPAFAEDPVRVLRVARFAARYAHLGFQVAPETQTLMQRMVNNGEVNALTVERVWQELLKALPERNPEVFIQVLQDCNALAVLFPELISITDNFSTLQRACQLSQNTEIRFAALLHQLPDQETVRLFSERYKIPSSYRQLAELNVQFCDLIHQAFQQTVDNILTVLLETDALRRTERFEKLLIVCEANYLAQTNTQSNCYHQKQQWQQLTKACKDINVSSIIADGFQGIAIKTELQRHYRLIISQFIA